MTSEILQHFKVNDPIIYKYIDQFKDLLTLETLTPDQYFFRLSRAIAFQQLHGKAATTIWGRFENLFPDNKVTPEKVLEISVEKMRECGFSYAKANYIKNIAEAFYKDENYLNLNHLSDEEVIELLTKIKGVGRWTAEMFLMFSLGREDVFSMGDLGLKNGIAKVYGYKKMPAKSTIERITKKWSPYRTYGSMALWDALDIKV